MFHQKGDGTAFGIAYKALVDAQTRIHMHGGITVVVERAYAHITLPLPFQRNKVTHDLLNLGREVDFVYGFLGNHQSLSLSLSEFPFPE